ncbi:hypothetical protein Tco_0666885 [Tanacetum coccineum]
MSTPTQWDRMSTLTQWDRMGTPTQCDMLCDTIWVSLVAYSASYSKPECEFKYVKYVDWIMLHASIGEHSEVKDVKIRG